MTKAELMTKIELGHHLNASEIAWLRQQLKVSVAAATAIAKRNVVKQHPRVTAIKSKIVGEIFDTRRMESRDIIQSIARYERSEY